MSNYLAHFAALFTPQREKARPEQVLNSAGGFTFALDAWAMLDRWLILGCEGGTYYASEQKLTRENAETVLACLREDGERTVARIVAISEAGRAPKSAPAIFALAMAAGDEKLETRRAALAALPRVCRIGTDLFHFARDVEGFRKWGRGLRSAVAAWYNDRPVDKLAYQAIKYQQRDGWSHRDLLRLSHPTAPSPEHDALYRWIVSGVEGLNKESARGKALSMTSLPRSVRAFESLRACTNRKQVIALIREHRFTHEMLLSEWKNDPEIWAALLEDMPQTALIRSLGKMTSVGLLGPMSDASRKVAKQLTDRARLSKARIHPVALLSALKVYQQGHGERAMKRDNALSWSPVSEIVDALNEAFYLAFEGIEPTGKKHLLALDVSGSMTCGAIAGVPGLTPRVASAAMAMATASREGLRGGGLHLRQRRLGHWPAPALDHRKAAARRRAEDGGQPPLRRHRLLAPDDLGQAEQGACRHLRHLHRQRDLGREGSPLPGAQGLPGEDGPARQAHRRRNDGDEVQHRRPERPRHARCRRLRLCCSPGDGGFRPRLRQRVEKEMSVLVRRAPPARR